LALIKKLNKKIKKKIMKLRNLMMGCFVASAALVACDPNDDNGISVTETDRAFIMQAENSNLAEIELGQVASTRGNRDSVKLYGQLMVTEHTMAKRELDTIAMQRSMQIPTTLDTAHQSLRQRLMTYTGKQFDTTYMNSQVLDHQATRALFQSMSTTANDKRLRDYASKYLPHIDMHLVLADTLARRVKRQP
jgi:putative membrane protein